jgi:hypothetical protein
MSQATNRSLPAEFLSRASAAGVHVIFYHYMKTNAYFATAHPEWVQRWPNGSAVEWPRGVGLSPCSDEWQDVYISQILELVAMGADAFYFDEFPASWGGDWSAPCLAKWAASTYPSKPGEPMPTALVDDGHHTALPTPTPVSVDRRVQLLMSDVTEAFFAKLGSAIERATLAPGGSGRAVSIVSVYQTPKIDNGYGQGGHTGLYETTQMVAGAQTAPKTELHIPAAVHWLPAGAPGGGDPVPTDVSMSFGFAMARDAAAVGSSTTAAQTFDGHRPPHVWVPSIKSADQALHSSGALMTWGAVANLDQEDSKVNRVCWHH